MKSFLKVCICLATALYLVGGHWALMQAVAWGTMLRDYSKESAFTEAVVQTFDGNHPCPMCLKIQSDKQKEEQLPKLPIEKLEKHLKCLVSLDPLRYVSNLDSLPCELATFIPPQDLNQQWKQVPTPPPPRSCA